MALDGSSERNIIVGGGPVGLLLAIYLAQRGMYVDIYEKREDPRGKQNSEGRSINLALSTRGLDALKGVGLDKEVIAYAVRMKGRLVHEIDRQEHFIPYSPRENDSIYSISRMELNRLLLDKAAGYSNIHLRFNEECHGINLKEERVLFQNRITHDRHEQSFSVIFDAEGIWSAIRTSLLNVPYTNFSQQFLEYDYKELAIPALEGSYQLKKEALHLWPRKDHLMIALPNSDGSFTCTLFLSRHGQINFSLLNNLEKANNFFRTEFPDAFALNHSLSEQLIQSTIGRLATIKISPWIYHDKILLIGDSAHGIVPFYGQGLNCGFEDCSFLNQCMDGFSGEWGSVFKEYEKGRMKNAEAIAELSLDNFIELREKVADPVFRRKRELETLLEAKFPNEFRSKYSMVTFSHMPYEEALLRGRKQDELLLDVCSDIQDVIEVDLLDLLKKINLEID